MQKFIKYSVAIVLFVILLPVMLLGLSSRLVKEAFMLGYNDINDKTADWINE